MRILLRLRTANISWFLLVRKDSTALTSKENFCGNRIWVSSTAVGPLTPDSHWGFGSSPVIYKHLAIVQCDTQNQSFVAAFNLADGKRVWQTTREEDSSWSTPTIYESKNGAELITSGTKYYRGYDPLTGKELWRMADGVDVKIPTPIATNDLYFLGGGGSNARRAFYAVRAGVKGEIKPGEADTRSIAWQSSQIRPHIVTPIVYDDYLYVCTDNGILSQYQAKTGEPHFAHGWGVAAHSAPRLWQRMENSTSPAKMVMYLLLRLVRRLNCWHEIQWAKS